MGDRLASPAAEALAHVLEQAPASPHLPRGLGHILAELAECGAAAPRVGSGTRLYDPVAREVIGQGPPRWATRIEDLDRDGIRCGDLGRGSLQVLQLQFELLDWGCFPTRCRIVPYKPRDLRSRENKSRGPSRARNREAETIRSFSERTSAVGARQRAPPRAPSSYLRSLDCP